MLTASFVGSDPIADIARAEVPECSDRLPVSGWKFRREWADGVASDLRRTAAVSQEHKDRVAREHTPLSWIMPSAAKSASVLSRLTVKTRMFYAGV